MLHKIPRVVIIESSGECNLKCLGCPINQYEDKRASYMSFDFYKSIVDRIDFPTTICPWMIGEPLLNPEYTDMIKYTIGKKIRHYITTNAHIWNEELFQRITDPDSTCYQVIFSIDGLFDTRSPSIEKTRPGSDRKIVEETVTRFMELKKKKGSKIDIATKLCERGQDYAEREEYISYWLDHGIDYVCIGRMFTNDDAPRVRTHPCRFMDQMFMAIRWDGQLIPCDYNTHMVNEFAWPMPKLGRTENLIELYNSEPYTKFRDLQNKGQFPYPCDRCGFAYTGDGFDGVLNFRNKKLGTDTIYYHEDYYNQFYSKVLKRKGASFNASNYRCPSCRMLYETDHDVCPSCGYSA
jgi:MoaA/NifB/PqqE/SkfB family radical SAM enzyme